METISKLIADYEKSCGKLRCTIAAHMTKAVSEVYNGKLDFKGPTPVVDYDHESALSLIIQPASNRLCVECERHIIPVGELDTSDIVALYKCFIATQEKSNLK